jgi:hypothetical protein
MAGYSHLNDLELLSQFNNKAAVSPIIRELCARLEKHVAPRNPYKDTDTRVECPVCEAKLTVEHDETDDLFTLTERS